MKAQTDNGIFIGTVTDLDDPERLGRVRVKIPVLNDLVSNWARVAAPMAGPERGTFFRPEVDDEVVVACEQGDPRRLYVLGSTWSTSDQPPPDLGPPKENNVRVIKSRSGHIIRLDDTQGQEKIEIVDKDGARQVIIDSAARKIQVICDTGDVEVQADQGSVKIEARTVEIKATQSLSLEAGGQLKIQGATVEVTGTPIRLN